MCPDCKIHQLLASQHWKSSKKTPQSPCCTGLHVEEGLRFASRSEETRKHPMAMVKGSSHPLNLQIIGNSSHFSWHFKGGPSQSGEPVSLSGLTQSIRKLLRILMLTERGLHWVHRKMDVFKIMSSIERKLQQRVIFVFGMRVSSRNTVCKQHIPLHSIYDLCLLCRLPSLWAHYS
ncbi:uncharacterized protein O3Q21_016033 [Podargus strigoides]